MVGDGAEGEAGHERLHHLAVVVVLVHLLAEEDEGEDAGRLDPLVLHAGGEEGDDGAALEQGVDQEEEEVPGGGAGDLVEVVPVHEDHHRQGEEAREGGGLVEVHAVHAGVLRLLHGGRGQEGERDSEQEVHPGVLDAAAEHHVLGGRVVGAGREGEGEEGGDDAYQGKQAEAAADGDVGVPGRGLHEPPDLPELHHDDARDEGDAGQAVGEVDRVRADEDAEAHPVDHAVDPEYILHLGGHDGLGPRFGRGEFRVGRGRRGGGGVVARTLTCAELLRHLLRLAHDRLPADGFLPRGMVEPALLVCLLVLPVAALLLALVLVLVLVLHSVERGRVAGGGDARPVVVGVALLVRDPCDHEPDGLDADEVDAGPQHGDAGVGHLLLEQDAPLVGRLHGHEGARREHQPLHDYAERRHAARLPRPFEWRLGAGGCYIRPGAGPDGTARGFYSLSSPGPNRTQFHLAKRCVFGSHRELRPPSPTGGSTKSAALPCASS
eukprot:766212-Hanusia_phi.AAC.2